MTKNYQYVIVWVHGYAEGQEGVRMKNEDNEQVWMFFILTMFLYQKPWHYYCSNTDPPPHCGEEPTETREGHSYLISILYQYSLRSMTYWNHFYS